MTSVESESCSECSFPLAAHDADVSFRLPSFVSGWSDERIASEVEQRESFLKIADRFFIRGLLSIFLRGDHVIVAGVWIEVTIDTLRSVSVAWDSPDYGALSISGTLVNDLAPWPEALGAQVRLEVRDQHELPYVVASDTSQMTELIEGTWPHELVLGALNTGFLPD